MIQVIGTQLFQWDDGRSISVSGSNATHVHMANRGDSYAVIMELVDGEAKIPNYLLQSGKDLCIYLVLNKVTQESKTFPVRKRERPQDYVYSKDKRNYIYELITEAEEATEAARKVEQELREAWAKGEFDGPAGDGKVKTVNGNGPDENGNVQVSSTCELEQPVWGHRTLEETVEEVRYGTQTDFDGVDMPLYFIPLTEDEFKYVAKYEVGYENAGGEDGPFWEWADEPLSYDEERGGLTSLRENRATLRIPKKEFVQIPGEYTGLGDVAAALDHIIALQEAVIG